MPYNSSLVCTYNTNEIFNDNDDIRDEDKNFIRDAIYRQELLNILCMTEYNEKEMDTSIHELYERVKESEELKECMLKLSGHFMSLDEEFGLMILFAYDYMYITHICISEYLETGKISQQNMWKLKSTVF
jgi:hypothetical protein